MTWTRFMDMHSGGRTKIEPYNKLLIEAPEAEARSIFEARFSRHPDNVTCPCCGEDYSVSEEKTIEQATGYDRHCAWDSETRRYIDRPNEYYPRCLSVAEYVKRDDVFVLLEKDFTDADREAAKIKPKRRRYYETYDEEDFV